MTWKQFEDVFNDKYFPTPVKQPMIQEFLDLKQRTLSVSQYAARFEKLARHADKVVPTDEAKARRFEWGLDSTIRGIVMSQEFQTYAQVVRHALMMEREASDSKINENNHGREGTSVGGPIRTNKKKSVTPRPYNQNDQKPHQQTPKREVETIKCYNCGQMDHFKHKCPQSFGLKNAEYGGQQQTGTMEDMTLFQGTEYNPNPFTA
ncbi:hypothetical protein Vadar_012356 [Vaccinium darrowii]|uniref:Uncharacterized protein n=1 Tax=Vaccinium darrowii TaxID=229202 RepID=A0ACB7Z3K2_9ERIC|nr:hypothetical protein Vadar_012356 [Vaccinium darrowii]